MSLLSGMNGMMTNEAALEAAYEQMDDDEMLAMEADQIIDSMVDGDEDLDDELDEMEEEALEAFAELSMKMDDISSQMEESGMEPMDALEAAYEGMMTCAEEFYQNPTQCAEVQSTLTEIAALNQEVLESKLTGDEFMSSLNPAKDDYDTDDVGVGSTAASAEFDDNASVAFPDDDDPNSTKDGSLGFDGSSADFDKNETGSDALESLLDDSALESLMEELDETAEDDFDSAMDSILDD